MNVNQYYDATEVYYKDHIILIRLGRDHEEGRAKVLISFPDGHPENGEFPGFSLTQVLIYVEHHIDMRIRRTLLNVIEQIEKERAKEKNT